MLCRENDAKGFCPGERLILAGPELKRNHYESALTLAA